MSLVKSKMGGGGGGWYPQVFGGGGGSQMMQQHQFVSVEQLLNDVPVTSLLNPHVNRLVRLRYIIEKKNLIFFFPLS